MSREIKDPKTRELNEAFRMFDRDKDGLINYIELGYVLQSQGFNLSNQELIDMISDVDENEDEVDEEDELVVVDQSGNEEIIDFPEAMTYDLDSLLNEYMSKTYLSSTDCNMRNENPSYPEEVFIERLSRMPTVVNGVQ